MAAKSNEFSKLVVNRYENVSDKYKVIDRIGRGSFGDVMMAKDVETREEKAIKIIELDFLKNDDINELLERIKKEAWLMSSFDHPNILKYYECFQYNNCLCIVAEYCEDNLTNVLRTHLINSTRPNTKLIIEWFYQLSQGLDYLHDRKDVIIHRDLKPTNILFKNSEIKIADFGESRLKSQATTTTCGTLQYMSPEMLRNEKFDEKTDIWSLGCVFYEIYYLEQAFDGDSECTLKNNILNRKIKQFNVDNTEIANLIDMMLDMNKEERVSIKQVLSHNIFKDFKKDTNKKDKKEVFKDKVNIEDEDNTDGQKVDIPQLIELCNTCENNYEQIRKLILEKHANVNYKYVPGKTALMNASLWGHKEVVTLLIENGALVNEKDKNGNTALILASENGQKEVVALLIDNGALVNEKDKYGYNALIKASREGHNEVVALLIQNGALVNEQRENGGTTLMIASMNGQKEVVVLLIQNGALVNEKDKYGYNALIKASSWGHKEVVALLIQNGALVNEKDKYGRTALMLASEYGHNEVVALLIQNGTLVNEKDKNGNSALMLASENGHKEVVALLIQNGALYNEKDKNGNSALMLASWNGHNEVVALLIQNGALF